jgi:hypothetical protein
MSCGDASSSLHDCSGCGWNIGAISRLSLHCSCARPGTTGGRIAGEWRPPGALDRMATAPCLQGNHKRPFAERQRQLDSHVGDVSWSRMAAAVAVADALEANATRGPVGTCQCCMHAVDVAVPAVDCPKSGAVPMSRARRVHNSGQMRCREAQEVSMRIVGDTARPTVCCVTCQKSVSRRSKRRAGMLKGNVAQND